MPTNCLILITKTLPNWAIPVIKFLKKIYTFRILQAVRAGLICPQQPTQWIIRTRLGGRTEDNLEFPPEKKKKKKRLILQVRSV